LEQQAVAGFLEVSSGDADQRLYTLPAAYTEVLVDADSIFFQTPAARTVVGIAGVMPQVVDAFRTGGGIEFAAYGADVREGIAAANRPMFMKQLASDWLPAMPDIDRRLRSQPPVRVADFGCGVGNSTLAIARAYPLAEVVGIDLDAASIEEA